MMLPYFVTEIFKIIPKFAVYNKNKKNTPETINILEFCGAWGTFLAPLFESKGSYDFLQQNSTQS